MTDAKKPSCTTCQMEASACECKRCELQKTPGYWVGTTVTQKLGLKKPSCICGVSVQCPIHNALTVGQSQPLPREWHLIVRGNIEDEGTWHWETIGPRPDAYHDDVTVIEKPSLHIDSESGVNTLHKGSDVTDTPLKDNKRSEDVMLDAPPREWTLGYDSNFDSEVPIVISGPSVGPAEQEAIVIEKSTYDALAKELHEMANENGLLDGNCQDLREIVKELEVSRGGNIANYVDRNIRLSEELATAKAELESAKRWKTDIGLLEQVNYLQAELAAANEHVEIKSKKIDELRKKIALQEQIMNESRTEIERLEKDPMLVYGRKIELLQGRITELEKQLESK